MVNHAIHAANAFCAVPDPGADQPLGGEHGHLRIVGDRADPVIAGGKVLNARTPIFGGDLRPAVEFDRRAQGVAHRAPQKAAQKTGGQVSHVYLRKYVE